MTPVSFVQANANFSAPSDLHEQQVRTIPAFKGEVKFGSCDGVPLVVVAWKPDERELQALNAGEPVFLSCIGGLPPHFLTVSFTEATNPA